MGQRPPEACQGARVGGRHCKATPVQNVQLSWGQRGPLASLWLPHLTLAAPSDSGPDTCFLPVLASGFFRSFYPLQEQEAWQKLVGGLPEYFIELDRKALASCIPGTT